MNPEEPKGTDKLIYDLGRKPPNALRDELLRWAREGRYHDFKSSIPFPKIELVQDLTQYGYDDLARKAKRGEYDDEPGDWQPPDEVKRELGIKTGKES